MYIVDRIFLGATLLMFLVGSAAIVFGSVYPFTPQEQVVTFWIPSNAEIRSSAAVVPGTFKIRIPLQEMRATTKPEQKIIVVYEQYQSPEITYWRAGEGGSFYVTTVPIPNPALPQAFPDSFFLGWKSTFDPEQNSYVFTPERWAGDAAINLMMVIVLVFVSFLLSLVLLQMVRSTRHRF